MNTNRQGFRDFLPTARANLRSVMGWNFNHCSTSLRRFVRQQVKEHSPSRIRYAFGKMSISHHVLNIQILYIDTVIRFYVKVGCFMQKVLTLVANFLVCPSNKYASLISAHGAFFPARQGSLPAPQKFFSISFILRMLNLVTIRGYTKRFNTNINADLSKGLRVLLSGSFHK